MFDAEADRCVVLGRYITEHDCTVREAAAVFGISKSTVHKDVTEKLKYRHPVLFGQVRAVMSKNKAERHLRGGEATRMKYEKFRRSSGGSDKL